MRSEIENKMKSLAQDMLSSGKAKRVLAWRIGELPAYPEPGFFSDVDDLANLIYTRFCSTNLSKYLIEADSEPGVTLVFLRPCDTYSCNMLLKANQIKRENIYIAGIGCDGCAKVDEGEEIGNLDVCDTCTKTTHAVYDELIGADYHPRATTNKTDRFNGVTTIESMNSSEKYAFWKTQLAKCIRCNACRNICPICHCKDCVFDTTKFDSRRKVNISAFEEQQFHIVRAFHVAGRCTDCGRCQSVCPTAIPINLLNRKFIKDINEMYGEFQAGEDIEAPSPLTSFDLEND